MLDFIVAQGGSHFFQADPDFGVRDYIFFLATLLTISAASSVSFIFAFATRLGSVNFTTSGRTKVGAAGFFLSTALVTVIDSYAVVSQKPALNVGDNSGQVSWDVLIGHVLQGGFAVGLLVLLILDVIASLRAPE